MVRRLKKDVLKELPAKRRQIIEIPTKGCSNATARENKAWEERQESIAKLQTAVELSKASDDPEEYKTAVEALRSGMQAAFTEMAQLRHATALAKVPFIIEHILESVDSSNKVVVFAHHRDVIAKIQELLKENSINSVILTGEMGAEERQNSVDSFQNKTSTKVFIGSIHAAGVGITLTAASHVIFAELDWVPGNMAQAEDRCHRIGQTESVLVQHLVLEGSLDATIAQTLVEKQNVIDKALDEKTAPADFSEKSWGNLISIGEITTKHLSKKQIEKEALEITAEEITSIHKKLQKLSAMCDGAVSADGLGFNKFDSPIGKQLALQSNLTAKQAVLGKKLITKYKKQLGE